LKATTHLVFGAGVAGLVAALAGCGFDCWLLALLATGVLNFVVDVVGHDHRLLRAPRRTRITHSLPGLALAIALVWLLAVRGSGLALDGEARLLAAIAAGGLSHWLLDALNPGGVYIVRRRFRLARIPYSSPAANALLQAAGALMIAYSAALVSSP